MYEEFYKIQIKFYSILKYYQYYNILCTDLCLNAHIS